jgi:AbrB family looped-hinge helix DNA binding protein
MSISRVTSRGRVTIPKEIREHLGLKPGDLVAFVQRGGEVVLQPNSPALEDLRGSIQARHVPEDFGLIRERVRKAVARRRAGAGGSG